VCTWIAGMPTRHSSGAGPHGICFGDRPHPISFRKSVHLPLLGDTAPITLFSLTKEQREKTSIPSLPYPIARAQADYRFLGLLQWSMHEPTWKTQIDLSLLEKSTHIEEKEKPMHSWESTHGE
jgi:hypothetical protein